MTSGNRNFKAAAPAFKKLIGWKDVSPSHEFGADCVRIMAFCLLLWVHFYLRNGFYSSKVTDIWGFAAVMFRPVFLSCVPLFAILTGYLKAGKPWSKTYYASLLPILISYLLISAVHLIYKIFWLKQSMATGEWILQFLYFKLSNYSWYIGMYIGLFLISPLINTLWKSIGTKKGHIAILLTLAAVSFLPATVNSITEAAGIESDVMPAYFTQLYYVAYYVTGCYIKTYRPKPSRVFCLSGVLILAAAHAGINIITRSDAGNYYSGYSAGYSHLLTAAVSVLLFLAVYTLRSRHDFLKKTAALISGTILEMYLISYIFDSNIYVLHYKEYSFRDYLWIGLIMTAAVFILSFVSGKVINIISRAIVKKL